MLIHRQTEEATEKIDLKPGSRVLISRTDRLGDLVLALPFVETMKMRYPECQIEVLASLYASPILENNPHIDRIMRVQNDQLVINKFYEKDMLNKIKRARYDVAIVLFPDRKISRLFYRAGIPVRIGTAGRFHSLFFSHRLLHSRKRNMKHEFEYNLDFLTFFKEGETQRMPKVYLREKESVNAQRLLRDAGVVGDFVVLHPGSGGSAERWQFDRFIRLYDELSGAGLQVVMSGSEREKELLHEMSQTMGITTRHIAGETDLRTLAAVLRLANVVVANSTGPLHLAVAVGTKVVGLYPGKKVMSPRRWGPLGRYDRVIQPIGPDCTCPPKQCNCMERITVERVAGEVKALLAHR